MAITVATVTTPTTLIVRDSAARGPVGPAGPGANDAYAQANAAYNQANAAYVAANSAGGNTDAYNQANNAYAQANAAYAAANSAANASANLLSVNTDIIPSANVTYNIGSQNFQWKDLWVSNNTIFIGGVGLSIANGQLTVGGNAITAEANTGNWTFNANTLSESGVDDAIIQSSDFAGAKLILKTRGPTEKQWQFDQDGGLTLPNNQKIDATSANVLTVGSSNASVYLDSTNRVAKIIAKKHFNRSFNSGDGATLTYTSANVIAVFAANEGLYFKQLLSRLTAHFDENTDFVYDYSNVSLTINPAEENLASAVTNVEDDGNDPPTYTITLGTAHEEPIIINEIVFDYDYNNTIGLDVDSDFFGIATDNDDLDLRSSRDIDLIAADDIRVQAGSFMEIELLQNDGQTNDGGIVITTTSAAGYNTWKFQFDGDLVLPAGGDILDSNGASVLGGGGNTGNVTFDDNTIIGTGDEYGGGGLYLAASANQAANDQLLRLRAGDDPTHIHLDTGDAELYDQYWGNDDKYLKLEKGIDGNGNVVIRTNAYVWTFGTDGLTTLPDGAIIDTTDDNFEVRAVENVNFEANAVVNIYTDGSGNAYQWQFSDDGSLIFPDSTVQNTAYTGGGGASLPLANGTSNIDIPIANGYVTVTANTFTWTFDETNGLLELAGNLANFSACSAINFVANSSGDGEGYSTIEIRPDSNATLDQYLIIDPTVPNHIHIRAGGAQDNSNAEIYLGGENSHFKVNNGENPSVSISANTFTWTFDPDDGFISFPDGSTQNTAFNANPVLNYTTTDNLRINSGVEEKYATIANANGTVVHNCSNGHIFYHTTPTANWTANFTNLILTNGYATTLTLVIDQGATPYYANSVLIDSSVTTINWQGNTAPTPTANRKDVISFSILQTGGNPGDAIILGQMTGF